MLYAFLVATILITLAEFGDTTQLLALVLAGGGVQARAPALLGVWTGSTAGMVIADGLAILVGAVLGKKLPEKLITRVSGVLFILFGLAMIASMLLG